MNELDVILGVVCSQPIGLSDEERGRIYDQVYKPLLKTMYNVPRVRFTVYVAGTVLEWLEKSHSEFVDVLAEMTKRRQVELLGGAFYEPFLPLIPKTDRIGQIERLTTLIRKRFGRRPRGAWIPGGVWDQRLTSSLQNGGIEYTFLAAGADVCPSVPSLTEDQGKLITVFPLCTLFGPQRFAQDPADFLAQALQIAAREEDAHRNDAHPGLDRSQESRAVLSLLIDAGHFDGPDSEQRIGWFSRLLALLEQRGDQVRTRLASKVHAMVQGTMGCRSFPTTTYAALMGPNAAAGEQRSYRAFLEDYEEAYRLYGKMLHTHLLVSQVRGDKYRKMNARDDLWRGQSHFAYSNNASGGIYRAGLRKATYAALIEAEKNTREVGIFMPSLSRVDVDLDGIEEVIYQGNDLNAYVHRRGAYVFELDILRRNWNVLDTLRRRPEPYHDQATRAAGYDSWPRSAFVDHLLACDQTIEGFASGQRRVLTDVGSLFYVIEDISKDHRSVRFAVQCFGADSLASLRLIKEYTFQKNRIDVQYRCINDTLERYQACFASEVNLSFHSDDVADLRLNVRQGRQRREIAPGATAIENFGDIQYQDRHNSTAISLHASERPTLWSLPVYAAGWLGAHATPLYQSNCAVCVWPLDLPPGGSREFVMSLRFEPLR